MIDAFGKRCALPRRRLRRVRWVGGRKIALKPGDSGDHGRRLKLAWCW